MACNKSKLVAVEEMNILLSFIEAENMELEREKNELRVKYHGRPQEERNIMKDILSMHNEFEKDILKLKEITEDFSHIPPSKNKVTDVVEKKLKDVANMQESIIKFQEAVQNLLLCKAHYQMENEEFKKKVDQSNEQIIFLSRELDRIHEYDESEDYVERYNALMQECDNLTQLIMALENQDNIPTNELSINEVQELTDRKASSELRRVTIENSMLEEAIDNCMKAVAKAEEVRELEEILDLRRSEVALLKEKYKRVQEEIKLMEKIEEDQGDDYTKKIRILDMIIGKKGDRPGSTSPKLSFQKKPNLLDDVIASLNKARAITSPTKFK